MNISQVKFNNIVINGYEGEYVFENIRKGRFYEEELLNTWTQDIKDNEIIYDIGANLGNHTVYFSKKTCAKEIYAFEPVEINFKLLQKNCEDNKCINVHLFNIAVGKEKGKVKIVDNDKNYGAIAVECDDKGNTIIEAIDELNLPVPNFVKIDVEGFEVEVLKGMLKTIEKAKPTIWIEVTRDTFKEVNRLLKKFGYKIQEYCKYNILYSCCEGPGIIEEELFQEYLENLKGMWHYRELSMKHHSAYLYEKNKYHQYFVNTQLEIEKNKQSIFEYREDLSKKQEEIKEYQQEIKEYRQEINDLKEKNFAKDVEIKNSEKQRKDLVDIVTKLETELEIYKTSKGYKLQKGIWIQKSKAKYYIKKYKYVGAYKIYRKVEKYPKITNVLHRLNDKFDFINNKQEALQTYVSSEQKTNNNVEKEQKKRIKDLKVACILDEFSYNCFKDECQLLEVEPGNWKDIFDREKPDLFLCESAWSGSNSESRPWKGQVYSSTNFSRENRTALLSILDYCKDYSIPTVFWNKEDPSHYEDKVHNFVDTAIKFDHIFTTAEECVEMYKQEYGHQSVHCLMFATQPKMFNPTEKYERTDEVIFAGSWYSYHEQRCKEMEEIFDKILTSGKQLKIYDRFYGDPDPNHKFPKKYTPYILPSLRYEELDKAYKGSKYALNITTVTESDTMFARRVFELISSNTVVISNYSKGIERLFGDNVIFTNKEMSFEETSEKCEVNLYDVLAHHTYKERLQQILDEINFAYEEANKTIDVYFKVNNINEIEGAIRQFEEITYNDKKCKIVLSSKVPKIDIQNIMIAYRNETVEVYSEDYIKSYGEVIINANKYFIFVEGNIKNDFIQKAILHYSYIDKDKGISNSVTPYQFDNINSYTNVVFEKNKLDEILRADINNISLTNIEVYGI